MYSNLSSGSVAASPVPSTQWKWEVAVAFARSRRCVAAECPSCPDSAARAANEMRMMLAPSVGVAEFRSLAVRSGNGWCDAHGDVSFEGNGPLLAHFGRRLRTPSLLPNHHGQLPALPIPAKLSTQSSDAFRPPISPLRQASKFRPLASTSSSSLTNPPLQHPDPAMSVTLRPNGGGKAPRLCHALPPGLLHIVSRDRQDEALFWVRSKADRKSMELHRHEHRSLHFTTCGAL